MQSFAVVLALVGCALAAPLHQNDLLPLHASQSSFSPESLSKMSPSKLTELVLELAGAAPSHQIDETEFDLMVNGKLKDGAVPIWPYPSSVTSGTETVVVSPALKFVFTNTWKNTQQACDRYRPLLFPHRTPASSVQGLDVVEISVQDDNADLQLETDESYHLEVTAAKVSITAPTQFGVYHALETLSQLVYFNASAQTYEIQNAPWVVDDTPRFKHREVLIDGSRHFLPVPTLKIILDAMSYAKLNVAHWHIVDSQSFPFISPTYPDLGIKGSYSPYEVYTALDVEDVVEYARQRGIRVMIEIDTPGHAASWCKGHPEVCPDPACPEPLNPATELTFQLIDGLFRDLTSGVRGQGLVPDNMLHLGGDEVNTDCWGKSASISQWLASHNYTLADGYFYFVSRVQEIARNQGRDPVGWEEIWNMFGTKLDKSTIIHQWLPGSTIAKECTAAGYRALWSTDGVWYLDGLSVNWTTMYIQEPCTDIDDDLCAKYMLGGGGEMWGETADTSEVVSTIFPRAAAIGERLWSPRSLQDVSAAAPRIVNFRCHLNRRGIAAAPVWNPVARSAPPGPGSCYSQ